MREEMKQILERLQCEYSIFKKGTNPDELEKAYLEALQDSAGKNYYPAILLVDEYVTDWLDYVFEEDYHREELMQTCKNNGKELLQERFREYMEDYQEDYGGDLEEFIGKETEGEVISDQVGIREIHVCIGGRCAVIKDTGTASMGNHCVAPSGGME